MDLELDTAPREVTVPDDLAARLAEDDQARRFFEGLSYSQKQWFVLNVEGARTEETRQRRLDKALEMLHDQRAR